jgi:hypothetical protein
MKCAVDECPIPIFALPRSEIFFAIPAVLLIDRALATMQKDNIDDPLDGLASVSKRECPLNDNVDPSVA